MPSGVHVPAASVRVKRRRSHQTGKHVPQQPEITQLLKKELNQAPLTRKALRLKAQKAQRKSQMMMVGAATLLVGTVGTIYASAAGRATGGDSIDNPSQVLEASADATGLVSRGKSRTWNSKEESSTSQSLSSSWGLETNSTNVDTSNLSKDSQKMKVASTEAATPLTDAQKAGIASHSANSLSTYTTDTPYRYTLPYASTISVSHATGDKGNNYSFSQCTWWAYVRRHQLGLPVGSNFGNGAQWADSARVLGYSVSNTPQVGDIMVFARGQEGASSVYGHVAIVESVNADGSVTVSECGAALRGIIASRTISNASSFQYIHS